VGILYVTHHLDEVRDFARRVTVLRNGSRIGCWDVSEISSADLVRRLVGEQLADELDAAQDSPRPGAPTGGTAILTVSGLRAARLRELSLRVRPGEIVGIYGLTGSGREDALTAIYGSVRREAGSVRIGNLELPAGRPDAAIKAGVGYLPPDRKALGGVMDMSARHNLTLPYVRPFWKRGTLHRKPEAAEVSTWFDRMMVEPRDGTEAPLSTFSGGNQQKILLAKWLRLAPKVLLLDEPSQGVDIGAKLEVHRQITAAARGGAAVVVCSSEVEELVALCERVLVMRDGHVSDELTGSRVNVTEINLSFHADQRQRASGGHGA
jgi:ribose transport system ATP-binding protein